MDFSEIEQLEEHKRIKEEAKELLHRFEKFVFFKAKDFRNIHMKGVDREIINGFKFFSDTHNSEWWLVGKEITYWGNFLHNDYRITLSIEGIYNAIKIGDRSGIGHLKQKIRNYELRYSHE